MDSVTGSDKKIIEECAPGKPITVFSSTPPKVSGLSVYSAFIGNMITPYSRVA